MTLTVAVVGHTARQDQAHRLARTLDARLFLDNGELGEWVNHRRAWLWSATQAAPWCLIVQDDAVPVPGMLDHLKAGLDHLPDPGIVSMYLGTGYPTQWQTAIRSTVRRAGSGQAPWIRSEHLLHGVAVLAPTAWVADMIAFADTLPTPYDERLSTWAGMNDRPVWYTFPSLVDHADGPTVVDHADGRKRVVPRRAWTVGVPAWSSRSTYLRR